MKFALTNRLTRPQLQTRYLALPATTLIESYRADAFLESIA